MDVCSLCRRGSDDPRNFEDHHLTPKHKGGRKMGKIRVCVDCGNQVHMLFSNIELRDSYNTLEKLRANSSVQKWIRWVHGRSFGVCHKEKKRR